METSNVSSLSTVGAMESDVETNSTIFTEFNWASEWIGYIALCMFSLVLVIPTLGIVGLMVWEYFSDEAERKAERKKEIDQAMEQHFGGSGLYDKKKKNKRQKLQEQENNNVSINQTKLDDIRVDDFSERFLNNNEFEDEDDDDTDVSDLENLHDVDNVLKQADFLLHRRRRPTNQDDKSAANNFDEILT